LSRFERRCFDLAGQFDISCYIDIADDGTTAASDFTRHAAAKRRENKDSKAGDLAPADVEMMTGGNGRKKAM
jgi:hypothetical protein